MAPNKRVQLIYYAAAKPEPYLALFGIIPTAAVKCWPFLLHLTMVARLNPELRALFFSLLKQESGRAVVHCAHGTRSF